MISKYQLEAGNYLAVEDSGDFPLTIYGLTIGDIDRNGFNLKSFNAIFPNSKQLCKPAIEDNLFLRKDGDRCISFHLFKSEKLAREYQIKICKEKIASIEKTIKKAENILENEDFSLAEWNKVY